MTHYQFSMATMEVLMEMRDDAIKQWEAGTDYHQKAAVTYKMLGAKRLWMAVEDKMQGRTQKAYREFSKAFDAIIDDNVKLGRT